MQKDEDAADTPQEKPVSVSAPEKVDFMGMPCASGPRPERSPEEEKKMARQSLLYTASIIAVCVIIMLGLIYVPQFLRQADREDDKYNNFEFYQDGAGFWNTIVNKGDQPFAVPFYYHPRDLEDIVVESDLRARFFALRDANGSIFVTLDPDAGNNRIVIAGVEIAKITGTRYGLLDVPTRSAFTREPSAGSANTVTPVVTCAAADADTMVVWLVKTDKNLVSSEGNCIRVEFRDYNESIRVADRLMYHVMGIMD